MASRFQDLYATLQARADSYGIRVLEKPMDPETAGKFDGLTVAMNPGYDLEERCYYLAHALGSIVRWSQSPGECQALFDELRAAREEGETDPGRLERAIEHYRAFEEDASRYAVWLLADLGHGGVIPAYTNFARADIEALTHFHRYAVAPVWHEFFARWNQEVADGERVVRSYEPMPIPRFTLVPMRRQEILQEKDGKP